ncbi:MAG: glycosyltransferase [Acidiferrobacterales bacterium]|nr:glycosyltransferase [Acidiferrobacterales bacterium]
MYDSLSVIIPSFNRVAVLGRAIQSVLAQKATNIDIEIIVVDDGSTDQTERMVADRFPQVVYQSQANQGVSAARNRGLAAASHEWIALLDSDDEWLPNKVANQFALLAESELLICHTDEIWIRNGVRVNQMKKHAKQGGWIFANCLPLCAMSPSSMIIHRSVFNQVGNFDESLPACEDYDLWLRITAQFEVVFWPIPAIKKYGGHADQLSRQHWGMDRFRVLALEKILSSNTLNADHFQAAHAMLIEKLTILLKGARKHKNKTLITACETKLLRWNNEFTRKNLC